MLLQIYFLKQLRSGISGALVQYHDSNVKVGGSRPTCAQTFFCTPPENSGGTENSAENSGSHAKFFFCSMYELSQRHPVWVAEINVTACNSARRQSAVAEFLVIL